VGHAFISYVREDSHEVDRLQRTLEAAGVSVWRDTADLWPGEDWRMKIRRAITDDALAFIACFSSRSVARQRSYQNEELSLAIDQLRLRRPEDPWLIPVRFDDCDIPDRDIGGGRTLGSIQRVDLFGDKRDIEIARLKAAVVRILGRRDDRQSALQTGNSNSSPAIYKAIPIPDHMQSRAPYPTVGPVAFRVARQTEGSEPRVEIIRGEEAPTAELAEIKLASLRQGIRYNRCQDMVRKCSKWTCLPAGIFWNGASKAKEVCSL
jgi:TIR domain